MLPPDRLCSLGRRFVRVLPHEQYARNPRRCRSLTSRWPITHWSASLGPLGAGFQPAVLVRESNPRQPDYRSGALSSELTWLTRPIGQNPCTEHTLPTVVKQGGVRRWPGRIRDAGGSRTHSKLLCRQPPYRLAPAPRHSVSSPGVEPGPRPSQGRVRSATLREHFHFSAPPRNRTSSGSFEDCHAIRHTRRACFQVSRPGLEPGSGPSEGPMRSLAPSRRSASRPGVEPGPRL